MVREMCLRELPSAMDTMQSNLARILLLLPANYCPGVVIHTLALISPKKAICYSRTSKSFLVCTLACIRTVVIEVK